jgi:nitrite reductase/ring-hydroxylating ferredoxin subunit
MNDLADLVTVASLEEVQPGEVITRLVDGLAIALANVDGTLYAFDAYCSHQRALLEEGDLEGTTIHCSWHAGSFDVRTGCALTAPAIRGIRTYPVSQRDGWIQVSVAAHA